MAAANIAGRASTVLRAACTSSTRASPSTSTARRISLSLHSPVQSNSVSLHQSRIFALSARRLVRRELSSLLPLHSATASACLVSRLPSDASTSTEGRFVNYISPI